MVFITSIVGAALLSGFAAALPRPDSSINEPAVSAPDGTPITDTSSPEATSVSTSSGSSYGSSNYGSGSSYGSSNYGGSSYDGSSSDSSSSDNSSWDSSSSYGSGSGSYGSESSNYGGGSNSWDSSSSASWATTTALSTSTATAWQSYSTPSYGSGNSNWGNSGYNDCVQQCVASYGGLPATYTPTATNVVSYGSGATHTVIVAPTQGVLRYVPFAVNASVGDTIKFMWGANNHTVTKSSELTPCNKTSDNLFTSGTQNKDFVFTQVVNSTDPVFFYCGTPTHCQKGMFGIINPPNAFAAPSSVSSMMPALAANSSDIAAYASYTSKQTSGNSAASSWGNNIDMSTLPEWSHSYIAENVMYTRTFLAQNAEVLKDDGSIDLGASGSTPLMIPQDLSAALASAAPATSSTPAAPVVSSSSSASAAPETSGNASTSGAISMSSSKVAVGLVATFATFMML